MDSRYVTPEAYRALYQAIPEWILVGGFELVDWGP